MKKINETIAVTLMLLATVGTIIGVFVIEGARRKKFYTVELIARSPLNGNWYPKEFKVPFGKEAKIYIRNVETVSHGFFPAGFQCLCPGDQGRGGRGGKIYPG